MKRKLMLNIATSLLLEAVSIICAFILPRLIIFNFGSQYNGIVSSVNQFLSITVLLRAGVGGVTRAALYKPLACHDDRQVSDILAATETFMRKTACIFLAFLFILATIYPLAVDEQFEWFFTFSLIIILGLSTFAQYYFGITYQFLLQADQKQYVYSILQTAATILNTIFSVILIREGVEFRLVKLISAMVFAAIPIVLCWYVKRNYRISNGGKHGENVLKQRWDAFAHQMSAFVHENTDIVLLTLLTDLYQVSIYSVYFMVINGIKKLIFMCSSSVSAALGHIVAKGNQKEINDSVAVYELVVNVAATILFSCTAVLIVPFVMLYTKGVVDANYCQPVLGWLMCMAQILVCARQPYQSLVEVAGHFKQTRNGAILESIINIVISVCFVVKLGITGVIIGTICATAFRTMQYAIYASKHLLHRPVTAFLKRIMVTSLNIAVFAALLYLIPHNFILVSIDSYRDWIVNAGIVFTLALITTALLNFLAYPRLWRVFARGDIEQQNCQNEIRLK